MGNNRYTVHQNEGIKPTPASLRMSSYHLVSGHPTLRLPSCGLHVEEAQILEYDLNLEKISVPIYYKYHSFTFCRNLKGNLVLIIDNYRFNKDIERNKKVFWRCVKRNYGCKVSAVTRRAIRIIGDEEVTKHLEPLQLCRDVASLSAFYRLYHGECSEELLFLIPPSPFLQRITCVGLRCHRLTVATIPTRTKKSVYCEYVINKEGNRVLLINGHRFNKQGGTGVKVVWRCNKRNEGCKARVWTVEDVIIKYVNHHEHNKGQ
ncbi:unnamed protein product [Chilo suppressalis]|uniref:FLYWCH-type domain-containing protein n=1 Tax=Chilo suppressalis TaxID=168631 RepID=A0ABN8AVZ2_CHISP|nr:unnamed protein product [Chilo suppressalis]